MSGRSERVVFFLPDLSAGGTEKVVVLLANGIARSGRRVDLVVSRLQGPFKDRIEESVRLIDLECRWKYGSVLALASYLKRERPDRLYSALNGANLVAVIASQLAGASAKVVVSMHNHLEEKLWRNPSLLNPLRRFIVRWAYRRAYRVVGVSRSICSMLTDVWKLDPRKVALIKNPLDFDGLEEVITPIEHPYFRCGVPVFLAAGRLCRQKNYKMMLNAFALARARSDVRLIVLGEGELRPALEQRIRALRLEESVDLVGFVPDPLSWMRRADCYLLSSLWEGSPLALIEAMSVGLAIVATNCESGPKELLEDYPMGRLTPVGDAESFARAMLEVLEVPRLPFDVAKTFADRQPEKVARAYLDLV